MDLPTDFMKHLIVVGSGWSLALLWVVQAHACAGSDLYAGVDAVDPFYIRIPGVYCLKQNFYQPPLAGFIPGHGVNDNRRVLSAIQVSDVTFDLNEHYIEVLSHTGYWGLLISHQHPVRRAAVRNGAIRSLRGPYGVGVVSGHTYLHLDSEDRRPSPQIPPVPGDPPRYTDASSYPRTDHLLEKLEIEATWRGIAIGGGGNVIRDSTITVDGDMAVLSWGPDAVIENNTIRLKSKRGLGPLSTAIQLRDGDRSVIRNNRIVVDGYMDKAPVAIRLLSSKDVQIVGNTVEGAPALVWEDPESSHTERDNRLKGRNWLQRLFGL